MLGEGRSSHWEDSLVGVTSEPIGGTRPEVSNGIIPAWKQNTEGCVYIGESGKDGDQLVVVAWCISYQRRMRDGCWQWHACRSDVSQYLIDGGQGVVLCRSDVSQYLIDGGQGVVLCRSDVSQYLIDGGQGVVLCRSDVSQYLIDGGQGVVLCRSDVSHYLNKWARCWAMRSDVSQYLIDCSHGVELWDQASVSI